MQRPIPNDLYLFHIFPDLSLVALLRYGRASTTMLKLVEKYLSSKINLIIAIEKLTPIQLQKLAEKKPFSTAMIIDVIFSMPLGDQQATLAAINFLLSHYKPVYDPGRAKSLRIVRKLLSETTPSDTVVKLETAKDFLAIIKYLGDRREHLNMRDIVSQLIVQGEIPKDWQEEIKLFLSSKFLKTVTAFQKRELIAMLVLFGLDPVAPFEAHLGVVLYDPELVNFLINAIKIQGKSLAPLHAKLLENMVKFDTTEFHELFGLRLLLNHIKNEGYVFSDTTNPVNYQVFRKAALRGNAKQLKLLVEFGMNPLKFPLEPLIKEVDADRNAFREHASPQTHYFLCNFESTNKKLVDEIKIKKITDAFLNIIREIRSHEFVLHGNGVFIEEINKEVSKSAAKVFKIIQESLSYSIAPVEIYFETIAKIKELLQENTEPTSSCFFSLGARDVSTAMLYVNILSKLEDNLFTVNDVEVNDSRSFFNSY